MPVNLYRWKAQC